MQRLWILLAAALVLACSIQSAEVAVTEAEGATRSGTLDAVKPDGSLEIGGKAVKLEDLAELRVKGAALTPAAGKAKIILRNGDGLYADIIAGNDKALKVSQSLLGELTIKNNALKGIVFPVKEGVSDTALAGFFGGADLQEDQMLSLKGEAVSGFMENFSDKELVFDAGGQKRSLAYDQVAAFRFAALDKFQPQAGVQALLRLTDGSVLSGKLTALAEGALALEGSEGAQKVPLAALYAIDVKGGRLAYLSELTPKQAEEKPYVGGAPFIRSWRKNMSVSGDKLRIGRVEFSRGIGMHSYCRLAYDLGGGYQWFLADVGMDAGAAPNAACAYRVVADGKELASGQVKTGDAPKKLKVALNGAQMLELICDFGPDNDDAGDHFDWAEARLVK